MVAGLEMVTSHVRGAFKWIVWSASVLCTGTLIVIVQVGANKEFGAKKGGAQFSKNLNLKGFSLTGE